MANTKITNPELFNLGDSTSATQLPVMTTTQRIAMNAVPTSNIDYLVVAGGGAGGGGGQAGGGGAGGLRTNYGGASLTLNTATAYTVTVGAGGIGTGNGVSGSGSNSVFDYITSTITSAGGGGGAIHNISGADGGSGGGAGTQQTGGSGNTPSTTPSQGNAGGSGGTYDFPYSGGGGGGYVSVGSTGGNVSGNGGTGIAYTAANSITGSALSLAGGGGGGTYSGAAGTATNGGGAGFSGTGTTAYGSPGTPGTDNTGGGGGGTGNYQVGTIGASGGSGIVILRYPTADIASYTATGLTPTETTDGTDTILSFTTVGTGAITFTSSTPTGTISTGEMIFNSTTDKVEYFDGTKWYGITYEEPYPTSLKMFLDANNVSSNPGSGTVWTDLTGNGNNGALVNSTFQSGTPKYVNIPGTDGSATRVNLAGTGGTTQVTNLVGGTQPLTVQGYGYFSSSGSGYDYFFIFGNASSGSLVSIAKYDGTNKLYMYDSSNVLLSNYTVSLNTWYNLAMSVTGSTYKLYVNGVLEYTATGNTKNITSNTAQIGSYSSNATNFQNNFIGRVGEFRVYQAILTGTEILANFNNTKATYGL